MSTLSTIHNELIALVKNSADQTKQTLARHATQLEELRRAAARPDPSFRSTKSGDTPGARIVRDADSLNMVKRAGRCSIPLQGLFTAPADDELKTTITSDAVGSATSGIIVPQRTRDYVPGAERRMTVRDILPARPVESNAVEYPKENAFTNAASPQVEGSAKAESALTFTIATANIRTMAHWIPASSQVLDDWPQLGRIIDQKLLYGLKLREEEEILAGDGTGEHLSGLITEATSYAGTYDQVGDTRLDTLRRAVTELEVGDEMPDFAIVNPIDWGLIETIKDQASNIGNYVVGNPLGGLLTAPVLWGRIRLVVSNSLTANTFLVGDSRQAEVLDRMQATVMISTEHDDYFTRNLVAIRVEERIGLAVYRGSAFVTGSF